jgi:hypothetical protein
VSSLWASVVSVVLGFEYDEGLTLGRAVTGLNAYSKMFLWGASGHSSLNSPKKLAISKYF